MKYIEAESEPVPEPEAGSVAAERLSSLTPTEGWVVMMTDDLHGWRNWLRLESRLRGRSGDEDEIADVKKEIAELVKQVELEFRPVIMWAVRSRADQDDEVVPLVPTDGGLVPADAVEAGKQVIKLASWVFLDEDERRFVLRDGVLRRKLEWYGDKRLD